MGFRGTLLAFLVCSGGLISNGQVVVDDFERPGDGRNAAVFINRAMRHIDSIGHGTVAFKGTRTYNITTSIELPRHRTPGRRIIVLDGNGCVIQARDSINVFNRVPLDQKQALNKLMKTRFVFNDFNIKGGAKGINLCASYGSSINRCNFEQQRTAAIDVQFGLNTVIDHCNSTNAKHDNFILRTGADWGGGVNNSQSNHSVIQFCRVYARKGSKTAFKVLGSSGCALRDIISEGSHEIEYSIYVDHIKSTTVRTFWLKNLHLEHRPTKAGIFVKSKGITELDGIYYQMAYTDFPLVDAGRGADQITLKNVPHWVAGTILRQQQGGSGASWNLVHCHKNFYKAENWRIKSKEGGWDRKLPYYFSGQGYRFQINQKFGKK